jgi:NhaA family Na+:H+ antiporter
MNPRHPTARLSTLRRFLDSEASGGLILMGFAALALIVANSPLAEAYFTALHIYLGPLSVSHWVNDGLMAVFFLLVGLEIKREMLDGQLSTWGARILPCMAAAGGMVVPASSIVAFNRGRRRRCAAGRSPPLPTSPSRSACCRCSASACRPP